MKKFSLILLCSAGFLILSCYHARVETKLPASSQVIDKPFASSWIFGLVPPKTIEAAMKCPNGVAVVETELSFVNALVGGLTFGIYTPMNIKITCASESSMGTSETVQDNLTLSTQADENQVMEVFELAARKSALNQSPVYIKFE